MELKLIENYNDRELLELILSNQIVMEQKVNKIYHAVNKQFPKETAEGFKSDVDVLEEFLNARDTLHRSIANAIDESK